MRILILGLNYLPESTSIGPYTADLAGYLQSRGHRVQVVTGFPLAPQWRIWEGYRGRVLMKETVNGVPVLRTYLHVPADPSKALSRILFDLSFAVSALAGAFTGARWDVVVVISPPLQLGITGWLLALATRAKLFFHMQDLVPDAAVAAGVLAADSRAVRVGHAMERFLCRRADGIGVICEGFRNNLVAKGVPADKVTILPDYIDLDFVRPLPSNNGFRGRHSIEAGSFVVMYSGSIALKQGLQTFVRAAAQFDDHDGIVSLLVGEGPYLPYLKSEAASLNAKHLRFLPLQPRAGLPEQLSAANALVITQKKAVTDVVFPGKLLYYMAAGRPILAAVSADSETGRFVAKHRVGLVVPPDDPAALVDAIRRLKADAEEAALLGGNARRVAEQNFDRNAVLRRFADRLEATAIPHHVTQVTGHQELFK